MIKIDIFSGFLGAGKTTLIKKLISEAYKGENLVLIENEFGEIGIDGGFLKEAGIEIREMNSGCICCSLVGDFNTSLKEVLTRFNPDRILIEPSGVGKLSDVIKAVSGVLNEEVVLNSATAVVDAVKCKMYMKNFGEFFGNQIEHADCIVLSRTDLADSAKITAATELIRSKNEKATLITTPINQLSGADILSAMEQSESIDSLKAELEHDHHHHNDECTCGCHEHHHHEEEHHHHHHHHHDDECTCGCHDHHHHEEEHHHHHHHDDECTCGCHDHHADEVFTSWGKETAETFKKSHVETILNAFDEGEYGSVLRAKGYVKGEDGWIYFDYVPDQADVREGAPAVIGRVCVIGANINEAALESLFSLED
jgi:G3E family GTPase